MRAAFFTDHRGYVREFSPAHPRADRDGYVYQHLLIVERVIGKLLPATVEVHHVNQVKSDNRHSNLVVCENHQYHKLLHVRSDAMKACGNPRWRKCQFCKRYDDPKNLVKSFHTSCRRDYKRRLRRKQGAPPGWNEVGGTCRKGHPIRSESDLLFRHGQSNRCRVCVESAPYYGAKARARFITLAEHRARTMETLGALATEVGVGEV